MAHRYLKAYRINNNNINYEKKTEEMNYIYCNGPYITCINYFNTINNIHNIILMTFPLKMF